MVEEWILLDVKRNGDTFIKEIWWSTKYEGRTVYKNHIQYKSGHEEKNYYIECRDERYGTMANVRVAIKRIYR